MTCKDDWFGQGCFWIKGESLQAILNDDFELLIGSRFFVNRYGDYVLKDSLDRKLDTHEKLWTGEKPWNHKPWNYYPRGRVFIDSGTAYITLNGIFASEKILDAIVDEYGLQDLRIFIDDQNEEYENFLLK